MSMYMLMRRMSQDPDIAEHQLSPALSGASCASRSPIGC